jgi:hypothetical protein
MLRQRAVGVFLVRDADDHQHEARIVRVFAQPHHTHRPVEAVVHDVQPDVALIKVDAARHVARARRDVGEMRRLHSIHRVATAAMASTSIASVVELSAADT